MSYVVCLLWHSYKAMAQRRRSASQRGDTPPLPVGWLAYERRHDGRGKGSCCTVVCRGKRTHICGGGWREESCQGEWRADESKCPRPPRDATAEVEQATCHGAPSEAAHAAARVSKPAEEEEGEDRRRAQRGLGHGRGATVQAAPCTPREGTADSCEWDPHECEDPAVEV